jgi:hypothetical protein
MRYRYHILVVALLILSAVGLAVVLFPNGAAMPTMTPGPRPSPQMLEGKFALLSTHGNSSCSLAFQRSIATMPDDVRLQGSCCSLMVLERYKAQIAGLTKYKDFAEIPPDPYDIPAGLAKQLMANADVLLSPLQQQAYDYAMSHSQEKGPCCCHCWRWQVYEGLAKELITKRHFSGEQVTEVWNLSDGCGGDEHAG